MYVRAILDTYADVNIIPANMYRLVFKDPEMKKLAPSSLEIGTFTTDTVKIVGSCMFYLVQPGYQEIDGYDILCCCKRWQCVIILWNNTDAWINTA